jgi:hypothetical protein
MDTIRTDSGFKTLIINDGPETLVFDPSDTMFAEKFYRLLQNLESKEVEFRTKAEKLDAVEAVDDNGVSTAMSEKIELLHQVCAFFRSEIDLLFGEGTSQKLFGESYSLNNISKFFTDITPYIQVARSAKVAKYIPPPPVKHKVKPRK